MCKPRRAPPHCHLAVWLRLLCGPHLPLCGPPLSAPRQIPGQPPPSFFLAWTNFLQPSGWREASLTPQFLPYGPFKAPHLPGMHVSSVLSLLHSGGPQPSGAWTPLCVSSGHLLWLMCSVVLVSFPQIWYLSWYFQRWRRMGKECEKWEKYRGHLKSLLMGVDIRSPEPSQAWLGSPLALMGRSTCDKS